MVTVSQKSIKCEFDLLKVWEEWVQSTSDLVTVNLVANFDLVAIFWKTIFLCSKDSRFSCHFVKLLAFDFRQWCCLLITFFLCLFNLYRINYTSIDSFVHYWPGAKITKNGRSGLIGFVGHFIDDIGPFWKSTTTHENRLIS